VNSLPKTVTRQRRRYDLNPGPSSPESSTLTTRLQSHPYLLLKPLNTSKLLFDYKTANILEPKHNMHAGADGGVPARYQLYTVATTCRIVNIHFLPFTYVRCMVRLTRPWLLLRRCKLSNIGDRVRNISSNAENNPNPNIYTATYV